MSNYSRCRTNYFRTTDPNALKHLVENRTTIGEPFSLHTKIKDGECYYSFSGGTFEEDNFVQQLQEILDPRDCIIITEIGENTSINFMFGCCLIISKNDSDYIDIEDCACDIARYFLDNKYYMPLY